MTTDIDSIDVAARRLMSAAAEGVPCSPIRDLVDPTDVAAAYEIQQRSIEARVAQGARIVGRKIGLTSASVQQQLGVDRPDFGVLFADMDVSGQSVPTGRLLQPKIEAEVAFVLGRDLVDGPLDLERIRESVASAHAALEIVDSRIANWDISYADTVADNASSGLYVLGDRLPADVESRSLAMTMSVNGEVASTGDGAACLGDPLNALLWLAETAREYGEPLRSGQVVLSGALGPMVPVKPGDRVETRLALGDEVVAVAVANFAEESA